ncbi:MAG TPA: Chromate resistance protein ChrB [Candidatus Nitrosocosmicus sp.]|nr:Chromate resistance protein ChrB [Candidatus Nitrosocosmicus sp.]
MIKKPSSWIIVLYDVPSEPSKLKVRVWRDFKKLGALYPQMSLCILPNNEGNREKIEKISKIILSEGKFVKITTTELDKKEHDEILDIYRKERDKQYDEIVEECEEFIDEIDLNIRNNKFTQEEVEEMEEVLDGLHRWAGKALSLDWIDESPKILELKELLKKCQDSMDHFAGLSFHKK